MSGKIVKSFNVTKTAEGDKSGGYTTVLAAAVFVCDTTESNSPCQPMQ
jgi:arginine decarboxylase